MVDDVRQLPTPPDEPVPVANEHETCHCQGHRMILILGKGGDPTIGAVLRWALATPPANTHHRVWVKASSHSSPSWSSPKVPRSKGGETRWRDVARVKKGNKKLGAVDSLAESFGDCCFLEEVIVLAHGGTVGLYRDLPKQLPRLTGGRVVRKLVIYSCSSADEVYPGFLGAGRKLPALAGLVAQRRCPCQCNLDRCDLACLDPDGANPTGYRCPGPNDNGTLVLAGWYADGNGFRSSKLGFDPSRPGQPLTSPDGRMRRVTVSPKAGGGHTASSELVDTPRVFDGLSVRPNPLDRSGRDHRFTDEAKRLREMDAKTPKKPPGYRGPTKCPDEVGCLPPTA